MKFNFHLIIIAIILSGCTTYTTRRYSINPDNALALISLKDKVVNIGNFTSTKKDLTSLSCRGSVRIHAPDKEPFSEFIRNAFANELKNTNTFSSSAPVTLSGNIDSISGSAIHGVWKISMTITSTNGKYMSATEIYNFKTDMNGYKACRLTADALMPAVQNLIGKIVRSTGFSSLIEK